MKLFLNATNFKVLEFNLKTSDQYRLLQKANQNLEKDLQAFIDVHKHLPNAHNYWATTYRHLRSDDLEGLALYYYVIEIIKNSIETQPNTKIKLYGNFESYFAKYLTSNFPQIEVSKHSTLKQKIEYNLGPFKYLLKAYKYALRNTEDKSALKNKVWLSIPIQPKKHRFKHLLNKITEAKVYYPARLEDKVIDNDQAKGIRFEEELGFKDLVIAFKKAFQLKQNLKKINATTLVCLEIKQNKAQHFYVMLLKEKAVEKAINKYKPTSILYTTANTYPFARIISRQAFLNHIPFTVVACRPMFIDTRLEERLIRADLEAVNDAFVANNFAVWDKFSKNTLLKAGVERDKIFVLNQNKQGEKPTVKVSLKNALLILFSHEKELNQCLVDELLKLNIKSALVIRQHPLKKLTERQHNQLKTKFEITQDITSQPYSKYEFTNVLAITINSTAVLEAAQHGCGVIWLPYLNSRSIIFYEMMQKIGKWFDSAYELDHFLNSSTDGLFKCIESSQIQYKELFESKDETDQLMKSLNLKR